MPFDRGKFRKGAIQDQQAAKIFKGIIFDGFQVGMAEDLNPALSVGWCAFSVVTDVTEMVRKEGGGCPRGMALDHTRSDFNPSSRRWIPYHPKATRIMPQTKLAGMGRSS